MCYPCPRTPVYHVLGPYLLPGRETAKRSPHKRSAQARPDEGKNGQAFIGIRSQILRFAQNDSVSGAPQGERTTQENVSGAHKGGALNKKHPGAPQGRRTTQEKDAPAEETCSPGSLWPGFLSPLPGLEHSCSRIPTADAVGYKSIAPTGAVLLLPLGEKG